MSHPPETNKPLLSHNEESMTEWRKSQLPQSSRELAERICDELILSSSLARASFSEIVTSITALIDAWVLVREAEARLDESTIWRSIAITSRNFPERAGNEYKAHIAQLESVLATARKQLGDSDAR